MLLPHQALPARSHRAPALARHRMGLCVPVPAAHGVFGEEIPPRGLEHREGNKAICSLRQASFKPINVKSLY